MRVCEKNSSADPQVSEEGAGGGAPVSEEIPLKAIEVHSGADIQLQPVEDHTPEAGGCSKEDVIVWEALAAAGS